MGAGIFSSIADVKYGDLNLVPIKAVFESYFIPPSSQWQAMGAWTTSHLKKNHSSHSTPSNFKLLGDRPVRYHIFLCTN